MSAVEVRSELSFSDRVMQLLERVDYRRADTEQERDAIFRLRHDAYVREGAIRPNPTRRFSDEYDNWDNAYTFGLYIEGALASSFRMHVATPETNDIPAAHVFPELLKKDWGVDADIWGCPSFTQLARDGNAVTRWNTLHPAEKPRVSHANWSIAKVAKSSWMLKRRQALSQ